MAYFQDPYGTPEPSSDEPSLKDVYKNILEGFQKRANWEQGLQDALKLRQDIPKVAESLARGAIANSTGGLGDIRDLREQFKQKLVSTLPDSVKNLTAGLEYFGSPVTKYIENRAPGSEQILETIPRITPTHEGARTMENIGGVLAPSFGYFANKALKGVNETAPIMKGFKDEGNYRRVGEPQSDFEGFGTSGNDQGRISGGLIENAGRITRGSHPDDIKAQAELIQANLNNPEFNKALTLAKKHNPNFDLNIIKDMPESSIQKQHAIAKTYDLLTKESVSPELKQSIFNDYLEKHPELMKKEGIKDYDDLVTKSYGQLRKEVDQQFDDMVKNGIKMSFHHGDANYLDSKEMLRDAFINNHLYTFRGGDVHPYLNEFDPYYGLNTNEKFRAVHDYLGHGTTGSTFGRKGEEIAYGAHAQTLSPLARIAAAAETRGQNSFVNYSGINADLQKKMMAVNIEKEKAKHLGQSTEQYDEVLRDLGGQWQYAKQTGLVLPPEMLEVGYKGNLPKYIKESLLPENGINMKGYHYSNLSNLEETDPTKYGKGIRGAEAERLSLPGAKKERTYFYTKPGMAEPGLGKHQYETDLNNFYDTKEDSASIIKMADMYNRDKYGNLDVQGKNNDMERMIYEAGYSGYHNPNTGVGISFKPQKVKQYSND